MGNPSHYEVTMFAMFQGMADFDTRGWKIGLPPCCCCSECKSAYAAGWAIMKNDAMFPRDEYPQSGHEMEFPE